MHTNFGDSGQIYGTLTIRCRVFSTQFAGYTFALFCVCKFAARDREYDSIFFTFRVLMISSYVN